LPLKITNIRIILLRPKHGGRVSEAIKLFNLDPENLLDLSTGINPQNYPVPALPDKVWRCLPDDDDLAKIAATYYGSGFLRVTAGSQQSIEMLPKLLGDKLNIGIVAPTYAEHAFAWQRQGHNIAFLSPQDIEKKLPHLDCLVIVNPNNPSGYLFSRQQLHQYQDYFRQRTIRSPGYLIVDEAYMDCTPQNSIIPSIKTGNLIVLRSIGKFFGLAGIRCGFIFAPPKLLNLIDQEMMPWAVSHPARWISRRILTDRTWIEQNRQFLLSQSQRLKEILFDSCGKNDSISGCSLFQSVYCDNALEKHRILALNGVLVRLLDDETGLRIGLPGDNEAMNKLTNAIKVAFNWAF